MKITRTLFAILAGVMSAIAVALVPATAAAAGSTVLSLSPATGNYEAGANFSVVISENSGANDVDSARADLTYDAAVLQVTNFTTGGNPFTTCATPASASAGKITTGDCTLLGGKKQGKQTLATVTFKALA